MKRTPTILIGSPLLGNEAAFLRTLCSDLAGLDALIVANFVVGSRQIDFLVVTPTNAVLIELKNYRHPVFGQMNGEWSVRDAAGNVTPDPRHNAWRQTLEESLALSDAMKRDQRLKQTAPSPKGGYYRLYSAFLSFYPEIPAGSQVTRGDKRARVRGYAEVLDAIKNEVVVGWSITQWVAFARRALSVSAATLEAAVNPRVLAAHAHLTGYRTRLDLALRTGLAPLLESDDGERSGLDVIRALQGQQHYLLHGPTGSAKTFHLHHLALAMSTGAYEMPFLLEAKRYQGGDFGQYLRQSIAPFFAGDPTLLLAALEDAGRAPVLLIDALNECASARRDDLLRGALAFALRYDARIVVTAQDLTTPLAGVQAELVGLNLPRDGQKRAIYAYHASIEATPDLDELCSAFENAYDLVLAGRCHSMGNPPATRAELYDRYVAAALPRANQFMAAALLRYIAGQMNDRLAIALTRRTFEELADRFLAKNDAKPSMLDALAETRLIDLSADSFSFEHELLLTYLKAEHLRRTSPDVDMLADELAKPRNAHLVEFILPRITSRDECSRLIACVTDHAIVERIMSGALGAGAQAALRNALSQFLDSAIADVDNWTVEFQITTIEDGKQLIAGVNVLGSRVWTAAEERLAPLLAFALNDSELCEPACRLFDATEAKLREEVRTTAASIGFGFRHAWSETIRVCGGVVSYPGMLPCTAMLIGAQRRRRPFERNPSLALASAAMLERASATPPSDFAIRYVLEDHDVIASSDRIAANLDLIERAWGSGLSTTRLTVLHAFPSMRLALSEGDPALMTRALAILDSFTSTNWMLESFIAEIKSIFEAIPPPVSVDDALTEMRECIAPRAADDSVVAAIAEYEKMSITQVLAGRAYSLLGRIFEDFFQGAYYDAYKALGEGERLTLLALAAQRSEGGFHTDWILRELLKCDAPGTLPHFASKVSAVDFTSGFLQDEVSATLIAIEACARWSAVPPTFGTTTPEYSLAFHVIGTALFFTKRPDVAPTDIEATRTKWRSLDSDALLAAGAILRAIHRARFMLARDEREADADLAAKWPEEVEIVMLECIERRSAFSAAFHRHNLDGDLIKYVIDAVGNIGSGRALATLRKLSDDPDWGADAVRALASLQRRGIGVT